MARLAKIRRPAKPKPKPPKKVVPTNLRAVTPLIYYGGKSRDAEWIVKEIPPHRRFADVFGGGASVILAKTPSEVDIYNDIGNVCNFFTVLREHGEELYEALYYTNWSRQEFYHCKELWQELSSQLISKMESSKTPFREVYRLERDIAVEWARAWYSTVLQGYSHEELESSWKVAKSVDVGRAWTNHVDDLPRFAERFRGIMIEDIDFAKFIKLYDGEDMCFYLDPPYLPETRASQGNYMHEMPVSRHIEMLEMLQSIKGQAVVSMYSHPLYEEALKTWRRKEITHKSSIQNSSSMEGRASRTEVLWVKEREHGLWAGI